MSRKSQISGDLGADGSVGGGTTITGPVTATPQRQLGGVAVTITDRLVRMITEVTCQRAYHETDNLPYAVIFWVSYMPSGVSEFSVK